MFHGGRWSTLKMFDTTSKYPNALWHNIIEIKLFEVQDDACHSRSRLIRCSGALTRSTTAHYAQYRQTRMLAAMQVNSYSRLLGAVLVTLQWSRQSRKRKFGFSVWYIAVLLFIIHIIFLSYD
jgi:hypothetical protein